MRNTPIGSTLKEVFRRPEKRYGMLSRKSVLFLLTFLKPLWKLGAVSFCLTLAAGALGSLVPLSSKVLIDFVIMKRGLDSLDDLLATLHLSFLAPLAQQIFASLNLVLCLLLFLGAIMGILGIVQSVVTLRFQQEITFNIQTALFDHLLRFPLSILKEKQVGYLMSRVSSDVGMIQYFFANAVPQMLTNAFYFLFSLSILASLNLRVTVILLALLPVWAFINLFFGVRVRDISHQEMENQAQISREMQEVLSGAEVIKSNVREGAEVSKISGKIRELFRTRIKSTLLRALSSHLMKASKLITVVIVVWISVRSIETGGMTIGDMTATIAYVVHLSGIAGSYSSIFLSLQMVFASMERLSEMFGIAPEFEPHDQEKAGIRPRGCRGEVRFEAVRFAYGDEVPVLDGVSFALSAGDAVALIGPSGAGKTTLIHLLLKFNLPCSGRILLDGHDLAEVDTRWLRRNIGFVSQDVFLFNDTVENNIRYGRPDADRSAVVEAARKASMHADIERFPKGYDTMVGERGMRLSAGQRQRIAIARAFLKDPPILILDEPTSALDARTEELIMADLGRVIRGRTAFIITHRTTLTRVADRIFSFEGGTVVEAPTPETRRATASF